MTENHIEIIECPHCGCIQNAVVRHTIPWWDYTHICEKCNEIILESEWQEVKDGE